MNQHDCKQHEREYRMTLAITVGTTAALTVAACVYALVAPYCPAVV